MASYRYLYKHVMQLWPISEVGRKLIYDYCIFMLEFICINAKIFIFDYILFLYYSRNPLLYDSVCHDILYNTMDPWTPKFTKADYDPNRVIRFLNQTNLRVICCLLPVPSTLNEPTCGPLPVSTMTTGPITSDFHTLWPFPLESIIISGVFTKD